MDRLTHQSPPEPKPGVRTRWLDNPRRIARVDVRGTVSHFHEEELRQLRDQIDELLKTKTPWEKR